MYRTFLSGTVLLSAAPIAMATKENQNQILQRPQELPIYSTIFEKEIET